MSKAAQDFLDQHGGLSREYVAAHAEEAARVNADRLAVEMQDLAENPLDLRDVPNGDAVLRELPQDLHPLVLRDFFMLSREQFVVDGEGLCVRDWLLRGGDLAQALAYAKSYFILG